VGPRAGLVQYILN